MRKALTDCKVDLEGLTSGFDELIQARRCLTRFLSTWGVAEAFVMAPVLYQHKHEHESD